MDMEYEAYSKRFADETDPLEITDPAVLEYVSALQKLGYKVSDFVERITDIGGGRSHVYAGFCIEIEYSSYALIMRRIRDSEGNGDLTGAFRLYCIRGCGFEDVMYSIEDGNVVMYATHSSAYGYVPDDMQNFIKSHGEYLHPERLDKCLTKLTISKNVWVDE